MFSATTLLLSILTLAVSVAAQNNVLIGFRRVSTAQATLYQNDGGILKYTPNLVGIQLGTGSYMLRDLNDWPANQWDCAFFANKDDWNAINKAWVPPTDGCTALWWKSQNIPPYLQNLKPTLSTANTALLAWMDGPEGVQQMLIPEAMLTNSRGLKVSVQCAPVNSNDPASQAQLEAIRSFPAVDYNSWNPSGSPGEQPQR